MKYYESKPLYYFLIILFPVLGGLALGMTFEKRNIELKANIKKDIPKLCATYHRFNKGKLYDEYNNIIPDTKGLLSELSTDNISMTIEEAKKICGET